MVHMMVAESWLSLHDDEVIVAVAAVGAIVLAWLLDRALARVREQAAGAARAEARHPAALPAADARGHDHHHRRPDRAAQFAALDQIATSLLASGAIVAAIVGFAARQSIADARSPG